jgi:hypothetical protein
MQPTRLVTPILIKNNFLLRGFEGYRRTLAYNVGTHIYELPAAGH